MDTAQRLPSLFDLDDQAYALMALLEKVTEPEAAEIEGQLDLIDQMMTQKTEGYLSVIRSLEAMAAARKVEADRLRDRAAAAQKQAEWLKARLLVHLKLMRLDHLDTPRFSLAIRQNPPKVEILEELMLPAQFKRTVITTTVDKRLILDHFKTTGEVVAGVEITRGERLSIS